MRLISENSSCAGFHSLAPSWKKISSLECLSALSACSPYNFDSCWCLFIWSLSWNHHPWLWDVSQSHFTLHVWWGWFIICYSHSELLPKLSQSLYLFPFLSRARYSGYISCKHSLRRKGSSFPYKYKACFTSQNLKQRLEISHHANRL